MNEIDKKTSSFGACSFQKTSPAELSPDTKALNFVMSFEEALKLNIALDEGVRKLNSYNRAKASGKNAGLAIIIHLPTRRMRVVEGKL